MYFNYSTPHPPRELQLLNYLQFRLPLSSTNETIRNNLSKGFTGELRLSELLDQNLINHYIKLTDLHFVNDYHTEFQIDMLLLFHHKMIILEVKNYEGEFYIQNDSWHIAHTHKEIRNPRQQLKRSHVLLDELLQGMNVEIAVESYLVFVNPDFTLYHAPMDKSVILPTQLLRFITLCNKEKGLIKKAHKKLANQLVSLHEETPQTTRLFPYEFGQLKKGVPCGQCGHFHFPSSTQLFNCQQCNYSEAVDKAIIRCTLEFNMLFPDTKITTSVISEWCGEIISIKRIRRILYTHLQKKGFKKDAYYTIP